MLFVQLAVLLVSFVSSASQANADGSLDRVKRAGVLRWGADIQGGEPYVYQDPKAPDRLIGFEVDIAAGICAHLGVRPQMVQTEWSQLTSSLARQDFDVILNGLEITKARAGVVRFSRPYYAFQERLMVRKQETRIQGLEDLRGRRTATLAQSLAYEMLRERTELVLYEGVEEPYLDLVAGRVDAVLLDDIIAARYGAPKPELKVAADVAVGHYAPGLRPVDAALAQAIDEALDKMRATGELKEILTRAGLWNTAQETASAATVPIAVPGAAPPAPTLTLGHVQLFVRGAGITLLVSTLAMMVAVPLGMLLALGRVSSSGTFRFVAASYVEVYRGTPVLLQLYLLYFGLAPWLRLPPLFAAVLGLGMNYAAYEAETYRAGIQAVPKGQLEAAKMLGLTHLQTIRHVLLPQAFRHALPNVTSDFIALLKDTSLVSVITVVELTKQMTITAVDVRSWVPPGLLTAALYFAMSFPLSIVARRLEQRLGSSRAPEPHAQGAAQ
jgi:polar amino acid transport system substrate-binding protein